MTTPPPTAPPSPGPGSDPVPGARKRLRGPLLVALVALALSALMGLVALGALGVALDARSQAADAQAQIERELASGQDPPATAEAGQAAPATEVSDPPTEEATPEATPTLPPDVLNPQAEYQPLFSGEVLNPQATTSRDTYIDLDEPRVGADVNKADIVLEGNFNVPTISLAEGDQSAAEASNPQSSPQDCADLIRTSPLPRDAEVPAQRGTVLCIVTSPTMAAAQGIDQHMVVLHVTALGDDGRVTLEVSAWGVPR